MQGRERERGRKRLRLADVVERTNINDIKELRKSAMVVSKTCQLAEHHALMNGITIFIWENNNRSLQSVTCVYMDASFQNI